MIRCAVAGATGYAGAELVRLLLGHPEVEQIFVSSSSATGEELGAVYPNLRGAFGGKGSSPVFLETEEAIASADVVFAALPAGHADALAQSCSAKGSLFIDFSADFRFGDDEATYSKWYGKSYAHPELHAASVYGLPELNRRKIAEVGASKGPRIIGNPGCYPTASTLGLFPALREKLAEPRGIIIDAKSGVTGAGKEPTKSTHYPECSDSIAPYKIGEHRHIPEISRVLGQMAGEAVGMVFTPHLVAMNRGIVATIYFRLAKKLGLEQLRLAYEEFYADERFVRVLPPGLIATNRNVRFSNYCDISVHLAQDGETAVIVSTIDNMVKGSAGQAIQSMNVALGYEESLALTAMPPAF